MDDQDKIYKDENGNQILIVKNPRRIKKASQEFVNEHTFVCECCNIKFINLNLSYEKYCSRKCASKHRKDLGWSPSKEARKKISIAMKGRKFSEETIAKLRKDIPKEDLVRVYIEENHTQQECADIFGCGLTTISRNLKEYDLLGVKSNQDAQLTKSENNVKYSDKDWLYNKYFVEKLTVTEIANICGAGKTTIKRWIKKHGFTARSSSEAQKGKKRSLESCAKQSETMSRRFASIGWGTNTYYSYKGKTYCGSWELATAIYFTNKGIPFLAHGDFKAIKYVDNGRIRHYIPDFYLPAEEKFVEIKGCFNEKAKHKMDLVLEQSNENIEIWFYEDLLDKDIISKDQVKIVQSGYYDKYLLNNK